MGYSQRAIFDKVESGSYRSGQKTAANSRPSEAEYFQTERAPYQDHGSSKLVTDYQLSDRAVIENKSFAKTKEPLGSVELKQGYQGSSDYETFKLQNYQNSFPIPFADEDLPDFTEESFLNSSSGDIDGRNKVNGRDDRENLQYGYSLERELENLKKRLGDIQIEINTLNGATEEAAVFSKFQANQVRGQTAVSPQEMQEELEDTERELDLIQISYNVLQAEHKSNSSRLQELFTKAHTRAAQQADFNSESIEQENKKAWRQNAHLKDELMRLKNNFKYKLMKKETDVQKVTNQQLTNEIDMLGMRYGSDGEVIKKDFKEYISALQKQNQELRSLVGNKAANISMAGSGFSAEDRGSGGKIEGAFQWLKDIGGKLVNFAK